MYINFLSLLLFVFRIIVPGVPEGPLRHTSIYKVLINDYHLPFVVSPEVRVMNYKADA